MFPSHLQTCSFLSVTDTSRPPRRAVHINGPALRVIRELLNVQVADLVVELECTPGYLSKLERGKSRRCSPAFLSRLVGALPGVDAALLRPALLACPYAPETHGATHLDDGGNTAPLLRPETGGEPPTGEIPAQHAATAVRAGGRHRARRAATA